MSPQDPTSPASLPADRQGRTLPPDVVRQAIAWMLRLDTGRADRATLLACGQWRQAHPDHELAWRQVQAMGAELRRHCGEAPPGMPDAGGRPPVAAELAEPDRLPPQWLAGGAPRARRRLLQGLALGGVAAAGATLAATTLPWSRWLADHATATGERDRLVLPDGTQLCLNTDTALDVRFSDEERLIVLHRGEIHVATGPDAGTRRPRPLRVRSGHAVFEARGTRFSLRRQPLATWLDVQDGAVAVQPRQAPADARPALARAGSTLRVSERAVEPAPPRPADPTGWTEGVLYADDMRLSDFLAEIGRHRAGRLDCDPAVAGLRLSGVFRLADTDALLARLPQALPVALVYRTRWWVRVVPRPGQA